MAPGAEAVHKVPGFKPHTRPKGQVSYLGGQGLSTHGYLLALCALVQNSPEVTHPHCWKGRATVCGEQNCRDASSFGLEYNHRGTASIKELSPVCATTQLVVKREREREREGGRKGGKERGRGKLL